MLQEHPIAYFSQILHGKHLLLSTYEKEILALILAVQKWRPYLLGKQFTVHTEHQSLKYLWSQKITTSAQKRWLYKLMGYDFKVEYKRGGENILVDALSRRHEGKENYGSLYAFTQLIPHWLEAIKEEVAANTTLQALQ